ncbi:hypothetical protein DM02DRAFT_119322 [Periconia macrospinosa]|uniref:Uncharacterized protein n=1 Tax=Periconia macrospinosa TaxID=97972 RepID=A0A2V1DE21_9PLEO|nr:hypothetical protein DM02DRAFT_119322 [Periconia macrospinosa]
MGSPRESNEAMSAPASTRMPLFITSSNASQQQPPLHPPISPLSNIHHEWTAPSTDQSNTSLSNNLLFITGTTPADFKSKKNMTRIRKKAMGSYLTREKNAGGAMRDYKQQSEKTTTDPWTSVRSHAKNVTLDGELSAESTHQHEDMAKPANSMTDVGDHASSSSSSFSSPPLPITTTVTELSRRTTTTKPESDKYKLNQVPAEFILPSAPIVIPMRNTPYLVYNSYAPGPFQSIGKPLDPFVTIYQASSPRVSVESLKHYCSRSFGTRAMGVHWIPAVVDSPHTFLSTLCIASAHLDAINGREIESVQTLALRQEVMHLIGQGLVNPQSRTNDSNIIALTQLIASEIVTGQEIALSFHEAGMEIMITQRGGLEQLGVKARIAPVVTWVMLESAVLQEKLPMATYANYAASHCTKTHPSTATIPESPLYCPRGEYETIKRASTGVTPRTLDLLKDVRMMIDLFLHETKQNRYNSLSLKNIHKKITEQYLSAAELRKTRPLTVNDWRYEAVRINAIIMSIAIIRRVPLSEALHAAAEIESTKSTPPTPLPTSEVAPLNARHDSPTTNYSTGSAYTADPLNFQSDIRSTTPTLSPQSTRSIALPLITPTTALLAHLKYALESSNLSQCWSEVGGVLLWIALTVGASSRQSDALLKKWYRALVVRVSIVLCFEHPEATLATLVRIGEVVQEVGNITPGSGGGVQENNKPSGQQRRNKRRRV